MNSAIRARREAEDGFTLIELLVVVIIIGILAAIAIPAFLNQRERAWQSELTSTVRNVALEVEAEATQSGGQYLGANGAFADLAALETYVDTRVTALQGALDTPVALTATGGNTASFQMCGTHDQITASGQANRVVYDSDGLVTPAGGGFAVDGVAGIVGQGIQDYDETGTCP